MPQNKNRDYAKENKWESSPEQKKRRAARGRARTALGLKVGDPREAGHIDAPRTGSLDKVKFKKQSFKANRADQPDRPSKKK